ncbi:hypothetical protein GCM10007301_37670 [Azorhizobium oxalatiphilum]|uniref:DUF1963 domain-containing protein n=1 Tax=Azorhizobium oxalatiphilum TaxID=980631 RepID=A0A917FER7_9HYPH|nr:YwqG family protein [Azorhizobium oxalatiphilum]GGF74322.1 hypothetical protein GCM10007301_37670 [Azorhizobium oxalatiphilum]
MFDSPADAQKMLAAYLDPPAIVEVVKYLQPAIGFTFTSRADIPVGATRFGGTPDLPKGADWPRPPAPPNAEEIAGRGNADAGAAMRRHMALNLPYAFIAQIDLGETAALGEVSASLPSEGRLLFFYDLSVGPWETGTRVAKVIWDRTPKADLAAAAVPPDMAAEDALERRQSAEIAQKFKLPPPDPKAGTNYLAPARAAKPSRTLVAVPLSTVEGDAIPKAERDSYTDAYQEFYYGVLEKRPDARNQLLGPPEPEQDDPRYTAAAVTLLNKEFPSSDEWKQNRDTIMKNAADMVLLLQMDVKGWMQADMVEGTVYFVIGKKDLEERRFDRVIAVYQQT